MIDHYQQAKRRAGSLDFQDLLISARDLLRHPEARQDLQARYDCVFIDGFQDTDPLQAEILLSLCRHAGPSASQEAGCSWWVTRSSPSIDSGAPTPASTGVSARICWN